MKAGDFFSRAFGKNQQASTIANFDEVHAYENYSNIKVFTTALGKKPHPRRTYITTNGDVCDDVLDDLVEKSKRILDGEIKDNGFLPFICMIDDEKEVLIPEEQTSNDILPVFTM